MSRVPLLLCLLACARAAAAVTFEAEDAPAPKNEEPPGWSAPRVAFDYVARLGVDTAFDSPGESVATLLQHAQASIKTDKGPWRLKLSLRLRWATNEEAPASGAFYLIDGSRRRSDFEISTDESSVETTKWGVEFAAGLLDVVWGQNPVFAAADVMNPADLRDGPFGGPWARLPVPAVRARGALGGLHWDAVFEPIFVPTKLPMFGNDWGPFVPGRETVVPDLSSSVAPSLLGALGSVPPATSLPGNDLLAPQGGLRLSGRPAGIDVAVTWAEIFDRQPRYAFSQSFRDFSQALQENNPGGELTALVNIQSDLAKGVGPLTGEYLRTRVFAFDAATTTGPVRWTLDAGYSPRRVLPTVDLDTVVHPMAQGSLGIEYEGPPVIAAGIATYWVFNVGAGERLLYLDSPDSPAVARNVVLPLGYVMANHRMLDDSLRVTLVATATPRGDFLVMPQAGWSFSDAQSLSLGAMFIGGPPEGIGWMYHHNDEVFMTYEAHL